MSMSKASLKSLLATLCAEFTGEVLIYAEQPRPARRPHKQKPTVRAVAYSAYLDEAQRLIEARTKLA